VKRRGRWGGVYRLGWGVLCAKGSLWGDGDVWTVLWLPRHCSYL
jgi:hypothetical protein